MSLVTLLTVVNKTAFTDLSDAWRQYVDDHRDIIRAHSLANGLCRRPSLDVMAQVRHNIRRYLLDVVSVTADCDWIVFLINDDFSSNLDFDGQPIIYVPDPGQIIAMYHTYQSTQVAAV